MSLPQTLLRVESWAKNVASETKKAGELDPTHTTILGRPLTSLSSNICRGKRAEVSRLNPERACKRRRIMEDLSLKQGARPRGRPSTRMRGTGRGGNQGRGQGLSGVANSEVFDQPESSQRTRPASPKKRCKTITQSKSDATIDMVFLESCGPRIQLMDLEQAKKSGPLPQIVADLYQSLSEIPHGFIPGPLKTSYESEADTPRKSRAVPPDYNYLPKDGSSVPAEHIQGLKRTVDQVVKIAARNYKTKAYERQWGFSTVGPLINEVLMWPQNRDVVSLNVENSSIEPVEIRMKRPNGWPLDGATRRTADQSTITEDTDVTTSRLIDIALGLELDNKDSMIVKRAFETMKDHTHSLNQSLSYIRDTPLFLDIELKRSNSNRDSEVQLAIWMAALHSKRLHHGWDTSMPMPGIAVSGHDWKYYITFERGDRLIMIGPNDFGSTRNRNSTYEIVHKLNILMQWGTNQYKEWFDRAILDWCRDRIGPD